MLEILRRRDRDDRITKQPSRHEGGIGESAQADGEIDSVGDEVDDAVGGVEIYRRIRLAAEELDDARGQVELGKCHRRADPHWALPLGARHHQVGLAGRGDQPGAVLVETAAFLRR